MDFGNERSVVWGMSKRPDDTHQRIRKLCTEAGMIMEDASAEAILWDGTVETLDRLAVVTAQAQALFAAAKAIVSD